MAAPTAYFRAISAPTVTRDDLTLQISASDETDTTDDNNIDIDIESDDDDGQDVSADYDTRAGSVVGFSISRAQVDMKSPVTPAAIKAQALESSKSYFETDPDGQNDFFDEPLQEQTSSQEIALGTWQQVSQQAEPGRLLTQQVLPPTTTKVAVKPEQRSSLVSSILGSTTRPRASSGSSIIEGIRKRLPGLPTLSLSRFSGTHDTEKKISDPIGPSVVPVSCSRHWMQLNSTAHTSQLSDKVQNEDLALSSASARLDSDVINDRNPVESGRPTNLRRATSDQSLYLRRAATGASDFDDYNAWSDVSERVNSRFKAITDSFQDSSLRRPRLPSIAYTGSPRSTRNDGDEMRRNLNSNAGTLHASESTKQVTSPADIRTSKHSILKDALDRMTGDLIVIGGYRGSILREAQAPHKQLWVPIKVGMNMRKADLEVGLNREDEIKMEEKIVADGTLSHIGPVDICRRLLRKCSRCPNVRQNKLRLHDYGWDWRLSPDLMSDRLIRFLEALPCNRSDLTAGERGAWVVAHSLGGIITRHAINRRPELFKGVVYAGAPQNCVNILGPLRNGDDVMFSSRVLTAQVNFTLRTSYALLPQNGRCFINKTTGERYDIDFFDVKTWDEYRLSPCIKAALLRHKLEKRTSLIGSLSEIMSQTTKRMLWPYAATQDSDDDSARTTAGPSSTEEQVKDKAQAAKDDIFDAAEAMKPDRPLSPTLAGGSSQSAKHKPSIATQSTIPVPLATEYLSRTLSEVLQFKHHLSHSPDLQFHNAYPPAAILFAKNTPTVYGAFVDSREAIKYDDAFNELAFAAGDGVVLASAAQLPSGYRCVRKGRVESERGHVGLLGDLEGVGRCLTALIDAKNRGVGIGAHERHVDKLKIK